MTRPAPKLHMTMIDLGLVSVGWSPRVKQSKSRPDHFPPTPPSHLHPGITSALECPPDPSIRTLHRGQVASIYNTGASSLSLSQEDPRHTRPRRRSGTALDRQVVDSPRTDKRHRRRTKREKDVTPKLTSSPSISSLGPRKPPRVPARTSSFAELRHHNAQRAHHYRRAPTMRPSPLHPGTWDDEEGYDLPRAATRRATPRTHATPDVIERPPGPRSGGTAGVLGSPEQHSTPTPTLSAKAKADRALGFDPHAKLASFYCVSGIPRVSCPGQLG